MTLCGAVLAVPVAGLTPVTNPLVCENNTVALKPANGFGNGSLLYGFLAKVVY